MAITRIHFSNGNEYLAWLAKQTPNRVYNHRDYGATQDSLDEGRRMIAEGYNDSADEIAALVDSLNLEIPTPRKANRSSVRGHRVNMGAYLSGSPLDMYQRDIETSAHVPVRIWVGTSSSIGITPAQLNKRGAALSAFALALSGHRTVYLTPYSFNFNGKNPPNPDAGGAILSVDLTTSPIVLSEVAAHFNVHVARFVNMYATHCAHPESNGSRTYPNQNAAAMRSLLGVQPDDIFLEAIHIHDQLLTDPVAWIKNALIPYIGEDASAA